MINAPRRQMLDFLEGVRLREARRSERLTDERKFVEAEDAGMRADLANNISRELLVQWKRERDQKRAAPTVEIISTVPERGTSPSDWAAADPNYSARVATALEIARRKNSAGPIPVGASTSSPAGVPAGGGDVRVHPSPPPALSPSKDSP